MPIFLAILWFGEGGNKYFCGRAGSGFLALGAEQSTVFMQWEFNAKMQRGRRKEENRIFMPESQLPFGDRTELRVGWQIPRVLATLGLCVRSRIPAVGQQAP